MINCCLCGSEEKTRIWTHKKDLYLTRLKIKKRINFFVCRNCGLAFANPRLDKTEIAILYTKSYRDEKISEKFLEVKELIARERIKFLKKHFPNISGHVLEIGSSEGTFLKLLRDEESWTVKGCEPYKPYGQFGISKWQIDTNLTFFNCKDYENEFDLIALMHVIEHIPNPITFINEISKVVKKGGLIFLETPNLLNPYKGRVTTAMFPAPHLTIYSPFSITNLLNLKGFEVLQIEEELNMRVLAKFQGNPSPIKRIEKEKLKELILSYKKIKVSEWKINFKKKLKRSLVKCGRLILPLSIYENIKRLLLGTN